MAVSLSLERGGTERHLVQILPQLAKRGHDVSVFLLNQRGTGGQIPELEGVYVIGPLVEASNQKQKRLGILRLGRLMIVCLQLLGVLLVRRPSIVHFFLPASYLVGAPASILACTKHKVMSRRSLNNYQDGRPFLSAVERLLHRRMDIVLGNSVAVTKQLVDEGVSPQRVGLIYNGIEHTEPLSERQRRNVRARYGLPPEAVVITVVSNLRPYKGHGDLLEALSLSRKDLPAETHILLAGRDDGCGADLAQKCKKLGLDNHVHFLGSVREVPELVGASDIFVLPSHEEGFSNALLEGMRAGLPVIATDVGGNPEAVVDGETGLLVPPRDPEQLGQAIAKLARDPAYRKRLGEASRQRVIDCFSLERCVDTYVKTYQELHLAHSESRAPKISMTSSIEKA